MPSKPIIVTSAESWVDIDAFACAVAYAELLRLQGQEAIVVIPGELNATIPDSCKSLGEFQRTAPEANAGVIVVDVSNPSHFAQCVVESDVIEIFDHHSGFESYLHEKLGEHSHIEMIGACATLIFEAWERAGKVNEMRQETAQLLAAAIASNTLNFQIAITCERDHHAFAQCLHHGGVNEQWIADYFTSCDRAIIADLAVALRNDTKREAIAELGTVTIGQLELWNSGNIVRDNEATIGQVLAAEGPWFLNAPSIGDHVNYLLASDASVKTALSQAIGAVWSGNVGTTPKLMLRKEILRDLHKLHAMG